MHQSWLAKLQGSGFPLDLASGLDRDHNSRGRQSKEILEFVQVLLGICDDAQVI